MRMRYVPVGWPALFASGHAAGARFLSVFLARLGLEGEFRVNSAFNELPLPFVPTIAGLLEQDHHPDFWLYAVLGGGARDQDISRYVPIFTGAGFSSPVRNRRLVPRDDVPPATPDSVLLLPR